MSSPTVFISYSHDSASHCTSVLELAQRLRNEGVEAVIDQFVQFPAEGWALWMQRQVERAHFILAVCSATYKRRFEGREEPGKGRGATWEGFLTTQMLYDDQSLNRRVAPILLGGASAEDVPLVLRGATRYSLMKEYDSLYRWLTNQPAVVPVPVGPLRVLPALDAGVVRSSGVPDMKPVVVSAAPVGSWDDVAKLLSRSRPHEREAGRQMWTQLLGFSGPSDAALESACGAAVGGAVSDDEAYALVRLITSGDKGPFTAKLVAGLLDGVFDSRQRTGLAIAYAALSVPEQFEAMLRALEAGCPPPRDEMFLSAVWLALEQRNPEAERQLDRIEGIAKRCPTNGQARRIYLRLTGKELEIPIPLVSEAARFQALRREVVRALRPLERVVRESLYFHIRKEDFVPGEWLWKDAERSVQNGRLIFDEEQGAFRPNARDRSVGKALEALRSLHRFISSDASADVLAEYETEHEVVPDLQLRPFWAKLGL